MGDPFLEGFFRLRGEHLVAAEKVIETHRGGSKKPKPRVAALVHRRPLMDDDDREEKDEAVLYILQQSEEALKKKGPKSQAYVVKRSFAVSRLQQTTTEGTTSVAFSVDKDEVLLTFESPIQRDVMLAAIKRQTRGMLGQGGRTGLFGTVASAYSATLDGAPKPQQTIQTTNLTTKKVVLAPEEASQLLATLSDLNEDLSDMPHFDEALGDRIRDLEHEAANAVAESEAAWCRVSQGVEAVLQDVVILEDRVEQYSREIVARRPVIDAIEHESSRLQRSQGNLQLLLKQLTSLCDQLTMSNEDVETLKQLRQAAIGNNLPPFLMNEGNFLRVVHVMDSVDSIVGLTTLEKDFPLSAVRERQTQMKQDHLFIAECMKFFMAQYIDHAVDELVGDKRNFSGSTRIVWKRHELLLKKLSMMHHATPTIKKKDVEGFMRLLRQYTDSIRLVIYMEYHRFLKSLRAHTRRIGWRGPFLLGSSASNEDQLKVLMTSREIGATPIRSNCSVDTPGTITPARSSISLVNGDTTAKEDDEILEVTLPNLKKCGASVFASNVNVPSRVVLQSAASSVTAKVMGTSSPSVLRPDVAFGMLLDAVCDISLGEEELLRGTFLLGAPTQTKQPAKGKRKGKKEGEKVSLLDDGDANVKCAIATEEEKLLMASLNEIFSGNDMVYLDNCDERGVPVCNNMLLSEMLDFVGFLGNSCDPIYTVPILSMIDGLLERPPIRSSDFMTQLLKALSGKVSEVHRASCASQTNSVRSCGRKALKSMPALLPSFSRLPLLINWIENMNAALEFVNWQHADRMVLDLVQQAFETLDMVSHVGASSANGKQDFLPGADNQQHVEERDEEGGEVVDADMIRRGYFVQFRHHAFFVAAVRTSLAPHMQELLASRVTGCEGLRDRFEELYLTRVLFAKGFPILYRFVTVAEDLLTTYQMAELVHNRATSYDNVESLLANLCDQLERGIQETADRLTRHVTAGIDTQSTEEGFHKTLLGVTWTHFADLLVRKVEFLERLVDGCFSSGNITTRKDGAAAKPLKMTVSVPEVRRMLSSVRVLKTS